MVKLDEWDKNSNLNHLEVNENMEEIYSLFHQQWSLEFMDDKLCQSEFCNGLFSEEANSTTDNSGSFLQRHKESKALCKVLDHRSALACSCDERIEHVSIFSSSVMLFEESNWKNKRGRLVSGHMPLCFAFTAGEDSERRRHTFPLVLPEGKQDFETWLPRVLTKS